MYGVRQSWNKLSVFQSLKFRYNTKPLYLWDGDAFMVMMHEKKLLLCNLKEETSEDINIQGQGPSARSQEVSSHPSRRLERQGGSLRISARI